MADHMHHDHHINRSDGIGLRGVLVVVAAVVLIVILAVAFSGGGTTPVDTAPAATEITPAPAPVVPSDG